MPQTPQHRRPRVPSYRLHKPSAQAVVTLGGKDFYLGRHGSPESRAEYDRLIAEWLAEGRPNYGGSWALGQSITVNELILAFANDAQRRYTDRSFNGTVKPALRRLRRLYGPTPVAEFGPKKLRAFQRALTQEAIDDGATTRPALSRDSINRMTRWVRTCFKWGVAEELVPPDVLHGLQAVEPIRRGQSGTRETKGVEPISDDVVNRTLAALPKVLSDMVRLQRLTGMRPGEVCAMALRSIDMSDDEVWYYRPARHKTAIHGCAREVPIGPRGQAILRDYFNRPLDEPLFTPAEAEAQRKAARREAAVTPMTPSRARRDAARANRPKRRFNKGFSTEAYGLAIRRACEQLGIEPHWTPNQLRHARATELRREFGLDAAGAVLGHTKLETTQIYAERTRDLSADIARKTG